MTKWKGTMLFLLLALVFSSCTPKSDQVSTIPIPNTRVVLPVPSLTATLPPTTLPTAPIPTASTVLPKPTLTATLLSTQIVTPTTFAEPFATSISNVTALTPPYEYLKLEDDVELKHVAWEADGLGIVYALTRPEARSAEAKDWAWWRYDLETGEKEPLPPPASRVTQEKRQQLDLCPTEQEPLETRPDCPDRSILLESPTSERIVFSPLSGGDTWLANIDGTNLIKLETLVDTASHAQWSLDGRWLLISVHFPGLPGQMTHYLIRADGSFETEFSALTDHDLFLLNGLFPQFSPDGTKLAYVGSTVYESFDESDYHLYLLDLESLESHMVSDRIGLFQWSADGQGLYVLDMGLYPVDPYEDSSEERKAELYYIDVATQPSEERIIATDIPYYPSNSSGTWLWDYTPLAQALAYVGHEGTEEFGVLLLAPDQSGE